MSLSGAQGSKAGKVAKIAIAAVSVSLFSTAAFLLWFEGEVTFRPLMGALICALLLTVPVTLFILAQVDKLHQADADLAEARRQLFAIHRELQDAQPVMEAAAVPARIVARVEDAASTPVGRALQEVA
jgi:hypothetical protein